jgi:hypothetical protein
MAKLKNTQALREMLAGEHKTQNRIAIQVPGKEAAITEYKVGDKWTDEDGVEWEQKEGYKSKLGKLNDLREQMKTFPNCYEVEKGKECKKNSITAIAQDWKMKNITGRCLDCQIAFEHKLKVSGEYERYEKQKLYENGLAWLVEAEKDKEIIKEQFRHINYANPEGDVEHWTLPKSFEETCKDIDQEFEKFRVDYIDKLEKDLGIVHI